MLNQGCVTALNKIAVPSLNKQQEKLGFDIDVFSVQCAGRNAVELFIKQGFKKAYAADITVTMPLLLAVNNGKLKAALGLRSAKSPLFVEQYLAAPIEQYLQLVNIAVAREQIVEIGHLYSNARQFTIPLFVLSAVSLFCLDFKYLVFSGTERVLNIIRKAGGDMIYLADADPAMLAGSDDNWGSYYQTKPKVVLICLSSVMAAINRQPVYEALFKRLCRKIAKACCKLEMLK